MRALLVIHAAYKLFDRDIGRDYNDCRMICTKNKVGKRFVNSSTFIVFAIAKYIQWMNAG